MVASKYIYNFASYLTITYFTLHFFMVAKITFWICHSIKRIVYWFKIYIWLKDTVHCLKNFQVRDGMGKVFRSCEHNLDTGSVDRRLGSSRPWTGVLLRMRFGWWPCVKSGRCDTDTSVSNWNFKEYWNSSVISWTHHLVRATHAEENNMPVWLLLYSWVV